MQHYTRRRVLCGSSIAVSGSLAGCSALSERSSDAEDLTFERLDTKAVYVADGVEISMPAEIETVDNPYNANVLILPADTDIDAEQVVEWLADVRVVTLFGDEAEATWLSWARSESFEDTFANEGHSDADPDPSLLIGAKIGLYVETYRHSWADDPRDRDVLRALDESLVASEEATPPE